MSQHTLEYSKSSRAKCNGAPPCKGTLIPLGALRYGRLVRNDFGEQIKWMHWGCVTGPILGELAGYGINRVEGFNELRAEDQQKIRRALATRKVDPADVPESAKVAPPAPLPAPAFSQSMPSSQGLPSSSQPTPSSSQPMPSSSSPSKPSQAERKRKAMEAATASGSSSIARPGSGLLPSQSLPPQSARRTNQPSGITWEIDDGDDDIEVIEQEPIDELYVSYRTNIVGVQYYKGLVALGQEVNVLREPTNRYDSNAVKITNMSGEQVGHIPKEVAAKLAPLMDKKLVRPEGVMNSGNMNGKHYTLPMTINIYADARKRAIMEPQLMWATSGRGFPGRASTTTTGSGAGPSHSQGLPSSSQAPRPGAAMPRAPAPAPAYTTGAQYPYSSQMMSSQPSPADQAKAREELMKKQEQFAKAAELRDILNNLEKVNDEGRRSSLLDQLCSSDDILKLPEFPNPPGKASGEFTVDLLKHQKQGLQWCYEHEYPQLPKKEGEKPVQFWLYKKAGNRVFYYNMATKTPQTAAPILGRGALVGDSMGLGKTLTMLSLIVATKKDVPTDGHSAATLIVVPLSIISNWEKQIQDHCTPGTIKSIVYYGDNRGLSAKDLEGYDVVITTYQTVAGEHANHTGLSSSKGAPSKKKQKHENSLMTMKWKRVILDEGHNIRNERTKMAQAIFALTAQRRWVLTGTPIINSPSDLGSMVRFLRICAPLDNPENFKRLIIRPLKNADPSGTEILRALMAQICMRRTKEMQDADGNPLVPLPPVEMTVVRVTLHPDARELYDRVEEISRDRIDRALNQSNGELANISVTTNALSMLTRLRQLALHPGLIPADYAEQLLKADEEEDPGKAAQDITPEERVRLQGLLAQAIEDNEECPVCFDVLDNPRITSCTHRFCYECILEVINRVGKCPMDRRTITIGDLIEPAPPMELTQVPVRSEEEEDAAGALHELRTGSSAKIDQLVHLLSLTPATEKSLVFSQFTTFLDKIAEALDEAGIDYCRFDGQMSARRRQETLDAFSVPLREDDADETPAPKPRTQKRPSASQSASASTTSSRLRRRASSQKSLFGGDEEMAGADDDDDFVLGVEDEDDDDFIDDEDDDSAFASKSKKGKGKAKSKGKGKAARPRKATYAHLPSGRNPKVMLISLKAGALGLNLTVANNVYLMDPWWQEGIESQAIDRCNRIGQTKPVHVFQLIAEDTVESKVLDIQEKKKNLIKEAFAGMKNKETQRQKKEARLQDLIHLFGVRLAASQSQSQARARPAPRQATLQFEIVDGSDTEPESE
ncbi:unnamed protein product [Peniophora sp. CBMAI 1063]|nr:unnamed protein product [Peniophora sp. CBMAI 1063]